jgi:hypothetical protein
MDIQLVSRDTELCRLYREVVAEFSGRFAMSVASPDDLDADVDLCILDFGAGLPIPPAVERRSQTIREPNSYRVDVRDSGTIPEENLHRIFEEYTSFADGHNRSDGIPIHRLEVRRRCVGTAQICS